MPEMKWITSDDGATWLLVPEQPPVRHDYQPRLKNQVYEIEQRMFGPALKAVAEKLKLPARVYGVEKDFIQRVLKAWNSLEGNMGMVLTGIPGSGKTLTGKQIAQKTGLPIILIDKIFDGLASWLSLIQEDVAIFMDEVEKTVKWDRGEGNQLLTLMDGVLDGGRKLFILTCNNDELSPHLENRPGRMRYWKHFSELSEAVVDGLVKHELQDQSHAGEVKAFLKRVEALSVDLAKEIIREVNFSGQKPEEFKDIFNVKMKEGE